MSEWRKSKVSEETHFGFSDKKRRLEKDQGAELNH